MAAEGDGLPGVVIDRYASSLVVQLTTAGAERWRDAIVQAAVDISGASHVYERSDAAVRELEGLARKSGVLAGDPEIGSRDNPIEIQEGLARFLIDIQTGHKTGFYLDQAENRQLIAGLAVGKSVLNCFSYTGGFGIAAAASGAARVVNVDSSAPALALGERAMLDHPVEGSVTWMRSDVKKPLLGSPMILRPLIWLFSILPSWRQQRRVPASRLASMGNSTGAALACCPLAA